MTAWIEIFDRKYEIIERFTSKEEKKQNRGLYWYSNLKHMCKLNIPSRDVEKFVEDISICKKADTKIVCESKYFGEFKALSFRIDNVRKLSKMPNESHYLLIVDSFESFDMEEKDIRRLKLEELIS